MKGDGEVERIQYKILKNTPLEYKEHSVGRWPCRKCYYKITVKPFHSFHFSETSCLSGSSPYFSLLILTLSPGVRGHLPFFILVHGTCCLIKLFTSLTVSSTVPLTISLFRPEIPCVIEYLEMIPGIAEVPAWVFRTDSPKKLFSHNSSMRANLDNTKF